MFRIRSVVPALGILAVALAASAGSLSAVEGAKVSFKSSGKKVNELSISGSTSKLTARDDGASLVLVADVASIKTGIGKRDDHLKNKFIKVHPISLTVPKSALKIPEDGKAVTDKTVDAKLKVNNIEKPVSVTYSAKNNGGAYEVTGKFGFELTNHGIEQPCFLGVCAGTHVDVTAAFKLKEK